MALETKQKHLFIAANPLQILMSVAIVRQLGIADSSILIIHGGFNGAKEISDNFSPSNIGLTELKVMYLNRREDAFTMSNKIKPNKLFVDGDVGFKNFIQHIWLKLFNPKLKVCIFEEGIGTYRNDLYKGFKRKIFQFLGIGVYFGGSVLTSQIYVIDPKRYKAIFPKNSMKVNQLNDGPCETILMHKNSWEKIFNYNNVLKTRLGECNLYLTNWEFNIKLFQEVLEWNGDHFVKLHPRCKAQLTNLNIIELNTYAPAELIVFDLSEMYRIVRVFHHGSSVEHYFARSNVKFIKF